VLNANWIRQRLTGTYDVPFDRPCMHEVVLSVRSIKQAHGVRALDVAKRLLEEGFHAPTVYFPLIVDEALMIEPTETESPQTLEALAESLERIAYEAAPSPRGPWPSTPTTPRCAGWTRPGRPAPSSPPSTPDPEARSRPVDGIFTTRFVDPYLRFHKYIYEKSDGGWASTATGCRPCCSPPPAGSPDWPAPTGSPTAATGAT
jgi:hypothetical protein